mmetsp:Transcript_25833/g.49054  ORF Transcript_25833/g.49054 Transcript_25833/m.49054 type:complete len:236 (-) Transcript_25833:817-1524(-)
MCTLGLVKRSHAGKHLALKELQGGTTTSGNVRHLVSKTCLLYSCNGVAATDDSDAITHLCQSVRDGEGSLGERLHLKHTHRSVPYDSLASLQLLIEQLHRVGTHIQAHPAIGDRISGHNLGVGVRGKLVSQHHVCGQKELHTSGFGLRHEILGEINLIILHQGGSHGHALRLVEGENHATTKDEHVALSQEGFNHTYLGRNLGPTHDGAEWALGLGHGTLQVVKLLLQKKSGYRW